MDGQFLFTLLKLLIFFPFVIAIILLMGKMGSKFNLGPNNRYMKVLERLPLSKDNSLTIVKIGDKGYLMSSSTGKVEILKELQGEELDKIKGQGDLNLAQMNRVIDNMDLKKLKFSKFPIRRLKKESEQ